MSENIIADLDLWLASIAAGCCMAFAYDFLRLLRKLVRHGRLAVDLEDLLYWTLCFFASFVLLYYGNNGVIRFVAVLGAALGMLFYTVSVGKFFVSFSYFLINKTILRLFRLFRRITERLHKIISSVNRRNRQFLGNVGIISKIREIKKNRLTDCIFCNTIKRNRYADKRERGSAHDRQNSVFEKKSRGQKKKNAKVSTGKK